MLDIIFGSYSPRDKFIIVISYMLALIIAFGMHEYAHGKVAYWNGDMTAKNLGRLTLNPLKHLDPLGAILLITTGFGWAKPVPINPNNFEKVKKGIFTVSIAGVTMNLILAIINFIFLLILNVIIKSVGGVVIDSIGFIFFELFSYFFTFGIALNLTLMAFNIIPIYPLDGFHIVEAFTKYDNKYCFFMRKYGVFLLFGLIIIGDIFSQFGGIFVYFDVIGLFVNSIRTGITMLMELILSAVV